MKYINGIIFFVVAIFIFITLWKSIDLIGGALILPYAAILPLVFIYINKKIFEIMFKGFDKKKINQWFLYWVVIAYVILGSIYWYAITHIQLGHSWI